MMLLIISFLFMATLGIYELFAEKSRLARMAKHLPKVGGI